MRKILFAAIALAPLSAFAGHRGGGGGGGGGPLHSVSSGLGRASGGSSSRGSSSSSDVWGRRSHDRVVYVDSGAVNVTGEAGPTLPGPATPNDAKVEGYLGVQKVHDSDESFTAELAVEDHRARVGASITRFYESQPGMQALTMTIPTFTIGVRLDDDPHNAVFLEGGVVAAKTAHDPVMNTSLVGGIAGLRFESKIDRHVALVGTAQLMMFEDDVRATEASLGVKLGGIQASMRVIDFNIGAPLYGPELGVRF